MSTVDIGIFRLIDPPAGQQKMLADTLAQITYPLDRLSLPITNYSEPDGKVRVRWTSDGGIATGRMIGTWEMRLGTQFTGWEDDVPFVFAHELGHLVDKATLTPDLRRRYLALLHASLVTYEPLGGMNHDRPHGGPDGASWNGVAGDEYPWEPDEAAADLFVAAFAPVVWSAQRRGRRFVHWTDDLAAVRRLVLGPITPPAARHGWVPPCLPVEVH